MEHTPNKQSKQDSYSLQNISDPTLESVSQEDDLDLETDKSSFESQFESQPFYQSSYSEFLQSPPSIQHAHYVALAL